VKNELLERQAGVLAAQAGQLAVTNGQLARQSALLEEQTHQLQELDGVKSRFFTNISHEFRTPLTLILAPLEKLLTGQVEGNQVQSHYQLIDRHARRLLQLINQLLDFSKLEAGSLKTDCIWGNVHQRIRFTTFSFASLAESKGIDLHFRSGYQAIHGRFDPDLLDKILNNLLSNALKFTPPGGNVTVLVSLEPGENPVDMEADSEKGWQLVIAVSDTGIGIPADQQDRIFDRFYQVDGSQHHEQAGTGIGLALVRELAALQGGSIAVASQAGRGARFTVQLPLAECRFETGDREPSATGPAEPGRAAANVPQSTPPAGMASKAPAEAREQCPLMLLVEDNAEVRRFIRAHFVHQFRLVEAADGAQGLQMALSEIPDIVITDRMMPKMDGTTLCRHLKTDERTSHVPVIMLTAKADQESTMEGLQTGADHYMPKPFSLHELSVRVTNLVDQRKKLRERFTREVKLQPKDIAITPADEVFLNKAILLIEAHMADTDFSVETFVHEIGMSRVQLHRKLKALTDQSTSEFTRTIRLKRAASLLEGQYGNVAEVMYEVGFNNVSYFASSFKKLFGVTPSEYQHEHAKEKKIPLA
jgi:signal transduction histidine kinase/DNA-binding response OmpR family regulator